VNFGSDPESKQIIDDHAIDLALIYADATPVRGRPKEATSGQLPYKGLVSRPGLRRRTAGL